MIRRLDTLNVGAHRLEKRAFEILCHHVGIVVAEILAIGCLEATAGEIFTNRRQVTLVVMDARRELRLLLLLLLLSLVPLQ